MTAPARLVVAVLGAVIGVLLVPATTTQVGPLTASVHLIPSLASDTVILLPPVGEVHFDTHTAPVRIEARVQGVDVAAAEQLVSSASGLSDLARTAPEDLTRAAAINALLNALFAAGGAALAVALTFRRARRSLVAGGSAAGLVALSVAATAVTFRPQALYQPTFEGLLSEAANVADIGAGTLADYEDYRATLAEFVGQVSALYIAADSLPSAGADADLVTVLHVSDIHDNPQAFDVIAQLDDQFDLDLVIDTGDIISWGTPWENDMVARIGTLDVRYVFVSGNHDGAATSAVIAAQPNATVLDNQVTEVAGLTIAGIGDPRFAADDDSDKGGWTAGKDAVSGAAFQLGDTVEDWDASHPEDPVDLALLHDPTQPAGLEGRVPLVLSGHMHTSKVELDRDGSGTDWLTVGSTGGALASGGVRPVLEGGEPLDLTARLLRFDAATGRLVSYDDVTMGGLGMVSVAIHRTRMPAETPELEVPADAETPATPVPTEQEVAPGEGLPDEERVTPTDPSSPLPGPSDSGEG
ncbi:metallophosphoesterase [Brachybacterium rhamnosum]|uniref:Metallophosphoesterase n=1 Tax=Brachybacterium rhamnosum TaxID=173361 RepID=A0ABW4PU26_9MICO